MSNCVLDASALLAYVNAEPGMKAVEKVLDKCVVSTVNLLEAFSKLIRAGMAVDETQQFLRERFPASVDVDREQAETAAVIHAATSKHGVSYADSICLALGACRQLPILTADGRWKELDLGFKVTLKMIR